MAELTSEETSREAEYARLVLTSTGVHVTESGWRRLARAVLALTEQTPTREQYAKQYRADSDLLRRYQEALERATGSRGLPDDLHRGLAGRIALTEQQPEPVSRDEVILLVGAMIRRHSWLTEGLHRVIANELLSRYTITRKPQDGEK